MRHRMIPLLVMALAAVPGAARTEEPLDIGSRLELFVDTFLIDRTTGDAALRLQEPAAQEVVLVTDKPWEGNTSAYYTILDDAGLYRLYYRGSHWDEKNRRATHREVTCYAESKDGVRWTKPELGLFEFDGSKRNNIVWDGVGTHNFTPFKDANPACAAQSRYKALGAGDGKFKHGLYAFQSADAVHWKLIREEPVITKGDFDSQNLAFWDSHRGLYADYHRTFHQGVRDIMTATSKDFLRWSDPAFLEYPGARKEHLYTNAVQPYGRAPHILVAFPTRFQPQRGEQVEPILMTSRDGRTFHRWDEPVIPVTAPQDRSGNRSNYMAWGMLRLPGAEKEISVYATEAYYRGPSSRLRRFTYRLDGFVSLHSGASGGELLTKPLRFEGRQLVVNYLAPRGSLRVEAQDAAGKPLEGFRLDDCTELRGDAVDQPVVWTTGANAGALAGKTVRLRIALRDADLFSLRFQPLR